MTMSQARDWSEIDVTLEDWRVTLENCEQNSASGEKKAP